MSRKPKPHKPSTIPWRVTQQIKMQAKRREEARYEIDRQRFMASMVTGMSTEEIRHLAHAFDMPDVMVNGRVHHTMQQAARIRFSDVAETQRWYFERYSGVKGILAIDRESDTGWVQIDGEQRYLTSRQRVEHILQSYVTDILEQRETAFSKVEEVI